MGIAKPIETAGSLEASLLAEYELLEECILGGQITLAQADVLVRKDHRFGDWLRARASSRLRG